MKKWLPFSSLVEQGSFLEKMIYEKYKVEKPRLFNEQANKINNILKNYDYNTVLNITIFFDGYIYKLHEKITSIDKNKKLVFFTNFYISLKNILDIEEIDIFDSIC